MRPYWDTGTVFQLDSNHCGHCAGGVIESVLEFRENVGAFFPRDKTNYP